MATSSPRASKAAARGRSKRKGYRLALVMPENLSRGRVQLLQHSSPRAGLERCHRARQELAADENSVMVYEYRNPTPPQWACGGVGAEMVRDCPKLFVAGLGTSWMLVGCGRRVKQRDDRHMALARAGWGPILDAAFTCSQHPGRLFFCPSEVEKDKPC